MNESGGKKTFIESLHKRRLNYLERALMCEELIEELGGNVEGREQTDSQQSGQINAQQRQNDSQEGGQRGSQERQNDSQEEESVHLTVNGTPDKRFKENETEAESKARHMETVGEGETDGRGRVTDPENDMRLKKNMGKRAAVAQS